MVGVVGRVSSRHFEMFLFHPSKERLKKQLTKMHYPGVRPRDSSTISAPLHSAPGPLAPERASFLSPRCGRRRSLAASSSTSSSAPGAATALSRLYDIVQTHLDFVDHFHFVDYGYNCRKRPVYTNKPRVFSFDKLQMAARTAQRRLSLMFD